MSDAIRGGSRIGAARLPAIAAVAAVALLACFSSSAAADTTHPYLGQLNLPGTSNPQTFGVDKDGNLLIWSDAQHAILKYGPDGEPVNFSALGTNTLDGAGGLQCGAPPDADCDRVPTNGFDTAITVGGSCCKKGELTAAIDQSSGPAAGHIYVINESVRKGSEGGFNQFTTFEVFDESGVWLGRIDDSQAFPEGNHATYPPNTLTVSGAGAIYMAYEFNTTAGCYVDKYVPVDGDPANIQFAGQLNLNNGAGADDIDYNCTRYAHGTKDFLYDNVGGARWRKFAQSEFTRARKLLEPSFSIDFSPNQCRCRPFGFPFGDGGLEAGQPGFFEWLSVDPETDDAYLYNPYTTHIEQWSIDNEKIGPTFGNFDEIDHNGLNNPGRQLAFDTSGGPSDGRIYIQGKGVNGVAVYGPPVTIPDLENIEDLPHHTHSTIVADIGKAGGPDIDTCKIEFGTTLDYGNEVPCSPAAPYTDDTHIETVLPGLKTEGDYHYRIVSSNANGTNTSEDFPTHPVAVLDLETKPPTEVSTQTATFQGELDRDGYETEYRFEYGIDTSYRSSTPFVDIGSAAGTAAVPPVTVDRLQPGRRYHYRLVARNELGVTFGNDQTFVVASAPKINGLRARDVTATSATLEAKIDSVNYATTYEFEYGTTTDYGTTVPVPAGDIAADTEPAVVTEAISGLENSTYHFRVRATNQWGTSVSEDTTFTFGPSVCPNEHVRQQTGASYLPDCRAYEIVSPGDEAPLQLLPSDVLTDMIYLTGARRPWLGMPAFNASGLASSPPRFSYLGSMGGFPHLNVINSFVDKYVATRTLKGWVTTYPGLKGSEALYAGKPQCDLQMDTCIDWKVGLTPEYPGSTAPYVWDVSGESRGRWPTNFAVVPGGDRQFTLGNEITGEDKPSPDFSNFVFSSREVAYAPGGLTTAPGSVYDNDTAEETVTIASKLPNGDDIPLSGGTAEEFLRIPAISADGSHILMSSLALDGPANLFMRVDGAITYAVSKGTGATYVGMTADGTRVVFLSNNRLTPDDTDTSADLYMWRQETDSLTRLSQGNGNGNSDDCNAGWIGQCGVTPLTTERPDLDDRIASESGDVYFFSPEQLDPDNPGVANERNLYVFHDGEVHYVTTMDPGTQINRSQISADGVHAAFLTAANLTPYDSKGWKQMYTFSLGTGKIRCASCLPSGAPPTIFHGFPTGVGHVHASQSGRFMSDDGRVVFATSDALVDRDTNRIVDVYEFTEGRQYLISAGTGQLDYFPGSFAHPDHFTGVEAISRDGVDIYFSTFDTLVPQDHIGAFIKFYDARTNGGFPAEPEFQPCVAADECHGTGAGVYRGGALGTVADLGSGGNAKPARRAKKKARAKRRRARARRSARKKRKRAAKRRSRATRAVRRGA